MTVVYKLGKTRNTSNQYPKGIMDNKNKNAKKSPKFLGKMAFLIFMFIGYVQQN